MRLKDYGKYTIVLSHEGNNVIKGLCISCIAEMKYYKGYAYVLVENGIIDSYYGTISHILDLKSKSEKARVDWSKV